MRSTGGGGGTPGWDAGGAGAGADDAAQPSAGQRTTLAAIGAGTSEGPSVVVVEPGTTGSSRAHPARINASVSKRTGAPPRAMVPASDVQAP